MKTRGPGDDNNRTKYLRFCCCAVVYLAKKNHFCHPISLSFSSLTPYDADEAVDVSLKKTKDMDVEISNCNSVSENSEMFSLPYVLHLP